MLSNIVEQPCSIASKSNGVILSHDTSRVSWLTCFEKQVVQLDLHDICLTTHKVLPLENMNQVQLSTGEHVLSFLRTEDKMLMTPVGSSLSWAWGSRPDGERQADGSLLPRSLPACYPASSPKLTLHPAGYLACSLVPCQDSSPTRQLTNPSKRTGGFVCSLTQCVHCSCSQSVKARDFCTNKQTMGAWCHWLFVAMILILSLWDLQSVEFKPYPLGSSCNVLFCLLFLVFVSALSMAIGHSTRKWKWTIYIHLWLDNVFSCGT